MEFRTTMRVLGPLFALVLASIGVPARCCPSALMLAPTTDVIPVGHLSMEYQGDSTTPVSSDTAKQFINTEIGWARNFEAGVDLDVSDDAHGRAILNGKYRFDLAPKLSAAVGAQSIDSRFKSIPYVTSGLETSIARVTLGALHYEGDTSWFVGLDRAFNHKLTLMADYVSGDAFYASAGLSYSFTPQFGLVAGAEFPNMDGGDTVYSVHFVMCGNAW